MMQGRTRRRKLAARGRRRSTLAGSARKLDKDDGMQGKGIKFVEKVVGSTKLKWTLETSILSRQGDILKQHKQILAYPYGNVITNMLYGAHGKEIIEGASKLALRTEATAMLNECERSLNLGGRSYPGLS